MSSSSSSSPKKVKRMSLSSGARGWNGPARYASNADADSDEDGGGAKRRRKVAENASANGVKRKRGSGKAEEEAARDGDDDGDDGRENPAKRTRAGRDSEDDSDDDDDGDDVEVIVAPVQVDLRGAGVELLPGKKRWPRTVDRGSGLREAEARLLEFVTVSDGMRLAFYDPDRNMERLDASLWNARRNSLHTVYVEAVDAAAAAAAAPADERRTFRRGETMTVEVKVAPHPKGLETETLWDRGQTIEPLAELIDNSLHACEMRRRELRKAGGAAAARFEKSVRILVDDADGAGAFSVLVVDNGTGMDGRHLDEMLTAYLDHAARGIPESGGRDGVETRLWRFMRDTISKYGIGAKKAMVFLAEHPFVVTKTAESDNVNEVEFSVKSLEAMQWNVRRSIRSMGDIDSSAVPARFRGSASFREVVAAERAGEAFTAICLFGVRADHTRNLAQPDFAREMARALRQKYFHYLTGPYGPKVALVSSSDSFHSTDITVRHPHLNGGAELSLAAPLDGPRLPVEEFYDYDGAAPLRFSIRLARPEGAAAAAAAAAAATGGTQRSQAAEEEWGELELRYVPLRDRLSSIVAGDRADGGDDEQQSSNDEGQPGAFSHWTGRALTYPIGGGSGVKNLDIIREDPKNQNKLMKGCVRAMFFLGKQTKVSTQKQFIVNGEEVLRRINHGDYFMHMSPGGRSRSSAAAAAAPTVSAQSLDVGMSWTAKKAASEVRKWVTKSFDADETNVAVDASTHIEDGTRANGKQYSVYGGINWLGTAIRAGDVVAYAGPRTRSARVVRSYGRLVRVVCPRDDTSPVNAELELVPQPSFFDGDPIFVTPMPKLLHLEPEQDFAEPEEDSDDEEDEDEDAARRGRWARGYAAERRRVLAQLPARVGVRVVSPSWHVLADAELPDEVDCPYTMVNGLLPTVVNGSGETITKFWLPEVGHVEMSVRHRVLYRRHGEGAYEEQDNDGVKHAVSKDSKKAVWLTEFAKGGDWRIELIVNGAPTTARKIAAYGEQVKRFFERVLGPKRTVFAHEISARAMPPATATPVGVPQDGGIRARLGESADVLVQLADENGQAVASFAGEGDGGWGDVSVPASGLVLSGRVCRAGGADGPWVLRATVSRDPSCTLQLPAEVTVPLGAAVLPWRFADGWEADSDDSDDSDDEEKMAARRSLRLAGSVALTVLPPPCSFLRFAGGAGAGPAALDGRETVSGAALPNDSRVVAVEMLDAEGERTSDAAVGPVVVTAEYTVDGGVREAGLGPDQEDSVSFPFDGRGVATVLLPAVHVDDDAAFHEGGGRARATVSLGLPRPLSEGGSSSAQFSLSVERSCDIAAVGLRLASASVQRGNPLVETNESGAEVVVLDVGGEALFHLDLLDSRGRTVGAAVALRSGSISAATVQIGTSKAKKKGNRDSIAASTRESPFSSVVRELVAGASLHLDADADSLMMRLTVPEKPKKFRSLAVVMPTVVMAASGDKRSCSVRARYRALAPHAWTVVRTSRARTAVTVDEPAQLSFVEVDQHGNPAPREAGNDGDGPELSLDGEPLEVISWDLDQHGNMCPVDLYVNALAKEYALQMTHRQTGRVSSSPVTVRAGPATRIIVESWGESGSARDPLVRVDDSLPWHRSSEIDCVRLEDEAGNPASGLVRVELSEGLHLSLAGRTTAIDMLNLPQKHKVLRDETVVTAESTAGRHTIRLRLVGGVDGERDDEVEEKEGRLVVLRLEVAHAQPVVASLEASVGGGSLVLADRSLAPVTATLLCDAPPDQLTDEVADVLAGALMVRVGSETLSYAVARREAHADVTRPGRSRLVVELVDGGDASSADRAVRSSAEAVPSLVYVEPRDGVHDGTSPCELGVPVEAGRLAAVAAASASSAPSGGTAAAAAAAAPSSAASASATPGSQWDRVARVRTTARGRVERWPHSADKLEDERGRHEAFVRARPAAGSIRDSGGSGLRPIGALHTLFEVRRADRQVPVSAALLGVAAAPASAAAVKRRRGAPPAAAAAVMVYPYDTDVKMAGVLRSLAPGQRAMFAPKVPAPRTPERERMESAYESDDRCHLSVVGAAVVDAHVLPLRALAVHLSSTYRHADDLSELLNEASGDAGGLPHGTGAMLNPWLVREAGMGVFVCAPQYDELACAFGCAESREVVEYCSAALGAVQKANELANDIEAGNVTEASDADKRLARVDAMFMAARQMPGFGIVSGERATQSQPSSSSSSSSSSSLVSSPTLSAEQAAAARRKKRGLPVKTMRTKRG